MPIPSRSIEIPAGKYAYFASDFHFGIPDYETSLAREREVCMWLDQIKPSAEYLFLMGDVWDTWLEYKKVVPKGTTRFLGKLAALSDAGVHIIFFTGNHDLWTRDYFTQELNIEVIHEHSTFKINQSSVHLGHGDGVGPGDKKYKLLKAVLRNKICQFLYRNVHPDLGFKIASFLSKQGPKHKYKDLEFFGEDKELQVLYAKELLQKQHIDYFVFGHRHIPNHLPLGAKSHFINLGDWLSYKTYARLGETMELLTFDKNSA